MPDIIAAFDRGAVGPEVAAEVTLAVAGRGQLATDLADGKLALVFLFDNGEAANGPHAVVGQDRVVLVGAPEHPLAGRGAVTPESLLHTEFLIAEPGCTTQMLVDRWGRDLTGRTPISMVTGSLPALVRMAAHARGVALLPSLTAARALAGGELVEIPVAGDLPVIGIEARWSDRREAAELTAMVNLAGRHRPAATDPVPA